MCGGFTCSKNALIALNILYVMVGFLLIGVGIYARAASIVTNLPIVGGILACGVILILISILGLAGAVRHHQVMLFFVSFTKKSIRAKSIICMSVLFHLH
ncbi:tetraspanin-31-like [Rhagoletis pomonella]|uniref:tetraspanin-31-like n=1 Tax=Rhagoletis pomonella TaxID=28610 RepID=UPI001782B3D5|nr:tetraspanin-31-like [Rhagoletis pomonella]